MITGVTIDGIDTLTRWGLILLADLVVGAPPVREILVEIPGRSGTINASYAISDGEPVYGNRPITFTLFKSVPDAELNQIRSELMALFHGREKKLQLPTDTGHYFKGIVHIGDISGYNSGKIPVSVTAEPYRYDDTTDEPSL